MQTIKTFPKTQAGMIEARAFYATCKGDASLTVGTKDDVITVTYTEEESKEGAKKFAGRKIHLFANHGVVCQRSKVGAGLRGEFIAYETEEFKNIPQKQRCTKCNTSKLFAFLTKNK